MSASERSNSGVFYPDEIQVMRGELSAGDVPDETPHEREARAQQIIVRSMKMSEAKKLAEKALKLSDPKAIYTLCVGFHREHMQLG